jgi:hypothetical protein
VVLMTLGCLGSVFASDDFYHNVFLSVQQKCFLWSPFLFFPLLYPSL